MKKNLLIFLFAIFPYLIQAQCFVQVMQTNVSCYGACDGTASAFPVGTGPYVYTWMPGNMTSQNVGGLCAGIYTLTMFDSGTGCTATSTVTISQPAILNLILNSTPASCQTCCDGSITATPGGGTPPYTYMWTPSGGSGNTAQGLCPGTYTCCVTDAAGCSTCSNLNVTFLTSVKNQAVDNNLSVYPNPASGFVMVDQSFENATNIEITLNNVLGQELLSKRLESVINMHESLDLTALPNGIYFINVKTDSGTFTRRVTKE